MNFFYSSQTCPQCRGVCTPASTHQIFFNLDIDVADVDKSYQEIKQSITALNASLPGTVEKILNSVVKKIEDGQLKRSLTNINLEFKEEMKLVK